MHRKAVLLGVGGILALAGAGVATASRTGGNGGLKLTGDDFARTRREALALFPRGLAVKEVASGLTALGFRCAATRHMMANISAPSLQCDSAGRGFPTTPHLEVTVIARDGALTDIAIGDGIDALEADARRPDPTPGGAPPPHP